MPATTTAVIRRARRPSTEISYASIPLAASVAALQLTDVRPADWILGGDDRVLSVQRMVTVARAGSVAGP